MRLGSPPVRRRYRIRRETSSEGTSVAKVWVLDTDTKGTGANMVPLERVLKRGPDATRGLGFPGFGPHRAEARHAPDTPEPRKPLEFRVIDIMTRQVLAEHADARTTVNVLEKVRSVVDVTIYVWDWKRERWRMLSLGETQALWNHRGRSEEPRAGTESSLARDAS
jgi:hypothetical protein